jgi:hypothetical protein
VLAYHRIRIQAKYDRFQRNMRVHAPSSKSTVRSIPVLQILATQSSVRCLCWSSRNSILGIGMSPAVGFYRLSAQEVTAHRRARHRQVTIGTTSAPLSPVWLHEPASNRHVGSYKLAKVRAQEELKHVSDPGVSLVCSLEWFLLFFSLPFRAPP